MEKMLRGWLAIVIGILASAAFSWLFGLPIVRGMIVFMLGGVTTIGVLLAMAIAHEVYNNE